MTRIRFLLIACLALASTLGLQASLHFPEILLDPTSFATSLSLVYLSVVLVRMVSMPVQPLPNPGVQVVRVVPLLLFGQ